MQTVIHFNRANPPEFQINKYIDQIFNPEKTLKSSFNSLT